MKIKWKTAIARIQGRAIFNEGNTVGTVNNKDGVPCFVVLLDGAQHNPDGGDFAVVPIAEAIHMGQ